MRGLLFQDEPGRGPLPKSHSCEIRVLPGKEDLGNVTEERN